MTKVLKPFYIDADVISDDDVEEICEVVGSLGGKVAEDADNRGSWRNFGMTVGETVWFDNGTSYNQVNAPAVHLKSMEEFREMFVEGYKSPNETITDSSTQAEPDFITLMRKYINLYPDMPTEEDKQYVVGKMRELCEKNRSVRILQARTFNEYY